MTLMNNGQNEKKTTTVWPMLIATCDSCFRLICPSCGIFIVPFFHVLVIHSCPKCASHEVDTRSMGCSAYWVLQLRGVKKEDARIESLLKGLFNLDSRYRLANFYGPFEDEVSALVLVSKEMGFFGPRGVT